MIRAVVLLISLAILAGCVTTKPVQTANGTYMISARVPFSGQSGAKAQALREAASFCGTRTVQLVSDNSQECALHGGCGEAQIEFRCTP
jgi:hypothetical protein